MAIPPLKTRRWEVGPTEKITQLQQSLCEISNNNNKYASIRNQFVSAILLFQIHSAPLGLVSFQYLLIWLLSWINPNSSQSEQTLVGNITLATRLTLIPTSWYRLYELFTSNEFCSSQNPQAFQVFFVIRTLNK